MRAAAELQSAIAMQRKGDIGGAVERYHAIIKTDPDNAPALHFLGLAQMQLGNLDTAEQYMQRSLELEPSALETLNDAGILKASRNQLTPALELFERALKLNPEHAGVLYNTGLTLLKLRLPQRARPHLQELVRLRPRNAEGFFQLARCCLQTSDLDNAIVNFKKSIKLDPSIKAARTLLGDAYESVGKFKQARLQYLTVLRQGKDTPIALAKLISLRDGEIDEKWIEQALALVKDPDMAPDQKLRLNISLGAYFDRTGSYDRAFHHYKLGYDYQFSKAPFNSDGFSRAVDRLIQTFSKEFFETAPRSGMKTERPVFIIGMPRSGTTLTEQILGSHSRVATGGELSTMFSVGKQVQQAAQSALSYPEAVRDLTAGNLSMLASRYQKRLDQISTDSAKVTDKLPFNFMHLGLIALFFPEARIVHCRRTPLDNCLSCFFVSFADEIQFANNLTTLGRYYSDYARLMTHWRDVLPMRMLDLQYEDLVAHTECVVRHMLKFCGLEWEDACLRHYETQRGVRTPSRWQVRQPIYSQSIGRWKHYESHLGPLIKALGIEN